MTIQEINKELEVFKKFTFEEEPHIYWWIDKNGNRQQAENSMTQLIHKYSNPFDAERVAPFSAKKLHMTTQQVLDMWEFENKLSTTKGTYIHKYMEEKWLGHEGYHYPVQDVIDKFGYDVLADKWDRLTRLGDKFYEDYKDKIEPIGLELVIGDIDYSLCGAIDFLARDLKTGEIIILDYKSNKEIKFSGYKGQRMLDSLSELDDCNYIHYSLQLNGYQHILEKNTKLKLKNTHYLIWINEKNDDYVVYTTKDLKTEAIQMIYDGLQDMCGY